MVSMLMDCPECSSMFAKNTTCPQCGWSSQGELDHSCNDGVAQAFAQRQGMHKRNYVIYMCLAMGTGLVGLLTAFMWIRLIYLGAVVALGLIGLLTGLTGLLGVLSFF